MWRRFVLVFYFSCMPEWCFNFPLEKCRSNKIDLAIHVATVTPIQKVRLKSIVNMFLPETDDENINNRIAIFLSSNLTQPLIGFNTYNSSRHLLQKLENLNNSVERHLQVVETLQDNSIRYFQEMEAGYDVTARVAVILCEHCSWRFDNEINVNEFKFATNKSYIETYIIGITRYKSVSWQFQKFINKILISNTDNLSGNQFFAMSLCGQCNGGWFLFKSETHPLKLSCYTLVATDSLTLSARCKALGGAHVVLLETNEEFDYLMDTLSALSDVLSKPSNLGTFKYNSLVVCKRYITHTQFSQWQNKSRKISGFSTTENAQEDSCFALEFHLNESNMNESWIQVSTDTDHANLVLCEFDVDVLKLRESDIGIANNNMMTSNENIYAAYNVKLFSCGPDKSIPFTFLYDGYRDCPDSSDENIEGSKSVCLGRFICDMDAYAVPVVQTCRRRSKCNQRYRTVIQKKCVERNKICDGVYDCLDKADEENCNVCMEMILPDGTCLPSQWFYTEEKYFFYTPRRHEAIDKDKIKQVEEMLASCSGTECKHSEDVNIHVVRCQAGEYSNSSRLDLQYNVTWAAKCVYLKIRYRNQEGLGCSDKSHLANCEKFVCSNGLFKCPNSYCIPYYMVFDGHSDCPSGEEESIFIRNQIFLPQLFPCRGSSVLIHPAHVCDGIDHCPTRDDELHCYQNCPSGFTCGFGVTEVTDHSSYYEVFDVSTRVLKLSGINLINTYIFWLIMMNLIEIHFSNCSINNEKYYDLIDSKWAVLNHLTLLDLSHNDIDISTHPELPDTFKVLNLSHTKVQSFFLNVSYARSLVVDFSFSDLNSFTIEGMRDISFDFLDLSNTKLNTLLLPELQIYINTLDMREVYLKYDDKTSQLLKSLSIKSAVYGDSYKLCCSKYSCPGIQSVKCFAPDDPVSSCNDLLGDVVKRTWLWLTGFIGTVGNIAVILIKLIKHNDLNTLMYTAINIVSSDLIMSVYLLIIAGADVYYRDDYVLYDTEWRDSSLCKAAGFLATLSYTSSGVFVVLVTSQLFVLHRYPTPERKHNLLILTGTVWYLCLMISIFPVLFPEVNIYSSTAMCIGFPLNMKHEVGWLFFLYMYIITACVEISVTIIGLILILKVIFFDGSFVESEIKNTKTLTFIILSHIFCGSIISITGLLSAVGINISPNRMGWLSVFVLPLNSVINPLLWIWQIVQQKWADYKSST